MNYYLRYFDTEELVHTADEAIDFLCSISEIGMTPQLEQEVRQYLVSDVRYPKRCKVRQRAYFIIIKTDANDMEEFKSRRTDKDAEMEMMPLEQPQKALKPQQMVMIELMKQRPGWYEGELLFKRVTTDPRTGKFVYRDTQFAAQLKAQSPMDCYQRLVEYLQTRVDQRSQFPSVKGKNFHYKFLGAAKA